MIYETNEWVRKNRVTDTLGDPLKIYALLIVPTYQSPSMKIKCFSMQPLKYVTVQLHKFAVVRHLNYCISCKHVSDQQRRRLHFFIDSFEK